MFEIDYTALTVSAVAYTTLIVFVNPEPWLHPETMTTGSPILIKALSTPNLIQKFTRFSRFVAHSESKGSANKQNYT